MEDYDNAAKRHFDDAELLRNDTQPRLANASHLYGISGECALKAIMSCSKPAKKPPQAHIPQIIKEFRTHSASKDNSELAQRILKWCAGFGHWKIEQRYYAASTFGSDRVETEAQSAKNLLRLLTLWKKKVF